MKGVCTMKKYIALALAAAVTITAAIPVLTLNNSVQAATEEKAQLRPDISIVYNGVDTNFKTASGSAVYPILFEDSTYLPLRAIGELIGKNVNWDESTKTITLSGTRTDSSSNSKNPDASTKTIYVQERGDFTIVIDGVKQKFKSASGETIYPILYEGSTSLPLRSVGEIMDCTVGWDDAKKIVTLDSDLTVTDADSFGSSKEEITQGYIGTDKAKEIALDHAGLKSSEVTFIKAKLDYDNGVRVYDVEFYSDNKEYDYEINAETGKILDYDYDVESWTRPSTTTTTIDAAKAKEIALNDAGLKSNQVTFIKANLDYDDGRKIYEVEFYKGNTEYDYEIDAQTGKIISFDYDAESYTPQKNNSSNTSVTLDKAKSIALNHAGVKSSEATFTKAKLDSDDGRKVYEIEFRVGRMEYECEVDASTGAVIDYDAEYDD